MNRNLRTTAMFKCVVTLKNGAHKILRLTIDKVAVMTTAVRNFKTYGLVIKRHTEFLERMGVCVYQISACRFINERTGEELLCL